MNETEGEQRWTIFVCQGCGLQYEDHQPFISHRRPEGEACDAPVFSPTAVVPLARLEDAIDYRNAVAQDHLEEKARAEAAERERDQAWAEAEEHSQEAHHWMAVHRNVKAQVEAAERALREAETVLEGLKRVSIGWEATEVAQTALMRIRATTTTEEVPHA